MSYKAITKALQMQLAQRYEVHDKYDTFKIKELESSDDTIFAMDHYLVNRIIEGAKTLSIAKILNDRIIQSKIGLKVLGIQEVNNEIQVIYKEPSDISKLFSEEDLRIANEFSKMNMNIVCIGFGGVSSNMFSYWSNISRIIGKPLFNKVIVFEEDTLEFHNLLRMPIIDPNRIPIRKIDLVEWYTDIAKEVVKVPRYLEENEIEKLSDNYLFIGAPNLATRISIAKHGAKALFTTNMNREFLLIPGEEYVDNNDVITETYGKLHLGVFGYGNLELSIEFMKYFVEERSGMKTFQFEPTPSEGNIPGIGYFERNNIRIYV